MKSEIIKKAVALGSQVGHILIATADDKGFPHVAASRRIDLASDGCLSVSEWFCPGTLSNLQANQKISLVVWDPQTDNGYQLIGVAEKVEDIAMMDGYHGRKEETTPLPQVERRILVRVHQVIHFSQAPHTDVEE
jgi:hypothetical protein